MWAVNKKLPNRSMTSREVMHFIEGQGGPMGRGEFSQKGEWGGGPRTIEHYRPGSYPLKLRSRSSTPLKGKKDALRRGGFLQGETGVLGTWDCGGRTISQRRLLPPREKASGG